MNRALRTLLLPFLFLSASLAQAASPGETADAFHKALRTGDGKGALSLMGKEATVFEQGFVSSSRDEFAKTQLANANDFAKKTERRIVRKEAWQEGKIAWVMTTTLTTGTYQGQKIDLEGTETMILRLEGADWRITHVHWSAHPREGN